MYEIKRLYTGELMYRCRSEKEIIHGGMYISVYRECFSIFKGSSVDDEPCFRKLKCLIH